MRSPALLPGFLSLGLVAATLGCRDAESPTAPDPVPALDATMASALAFHQVSAGRYHTCGVTTDNRAYCWGRNSEGQLGNGTATIAGATRPVAVAGTLRFRQISASSYTTCAVTTAYRAYCWGNNYVGQLGDGTTTPHQRPNPVAGGRQFRQVETGEEHTCAVTYPDNRAFCWGRNLEGQLGNGTNAGQDTAGSIPYRSRPVASPAGSPSARSAPASGIPVARPPTTGPSAGARMDTVKSVTAPRFRCVSSQPGSPAPGHTARWTRGSGIPAL